jgi:oxaloacetate decarboxylase gamma subunit
MITTGITLMVIGMVTVFCVLLFIILVSKGLIFIVNIAIPETSEKKPQIPDDICEVISKTVFQITGGKGKVAEIKETK